MHIFTLNHWGVVTLGTHLFFTIVDIIITIIFIPLILLQKTMTVPHKDDTAGDAASEVKEDYSKAQKMDESPIVGLSSKFSPKGELDVILNGVKKTIIVHKFTCKKCDTVCIWTLQGSTLS